jgi:hypothetical protein
LCVKNNFTLNDAYIDELIAEKRLKILNSEFNPSVSVKKVYELFKVLNQNERKSLIEKFIENIDSYESESLDAAIRQNEYKKEIKNLQKLIDFHCKNNFIKLVNTDNQLKKYSANQPEKIFQNWIESNLWIFGVEYHKKYNFSKIGVDNSKADLLLETMDGFLNLIELKRPISKNKMFKYDNSHRSYFPASDFSKAIGQCLIYLQRIVDYKHKLENEQSVRILQPRIKLIIGRSKNFNTKEREALHYINSSLNNIEVITFDQLLENGRKIISFYEKER